MYGFLSVIAYLVGASTVVSCLVMGSMVLMEPAKQPTASVAHSAHAQTKSIDLAAKHAPAHVAAVHHEVKAEPAKKVARVHIKQRVHKKPAVKYAKQRRTTSSASAYAYAPEEPQRTLFGVPLLFSNGAAN